MVYGDFTSVNSAIAVSAASNWASVSRAASAGSAAITASQVLASSRPANSAGACATNTSTTCGSNWVPRRCMATATAASVPPARWNTSTTSASVTSREVSRIWSPRRPFGTPLPSQRSKVCSTLSRTRCASPSRAARLSAARQWLSSMAAAAFLPSAANATPSLARSAAVLPAPRCRSMNSGPDRALWKSTRRKSVLSTVSSPNHFACS